MFFKGLDGKGANFGDREGEGGVQSRKKGKKSFFREKKKGGRYYSRLGERHPPVNGGKPKSVLGRKKRPSYWK